MWVKVTPTSSSKKQYGIKNLNKTNCGTVPKLVGTKATPPFPPSLPRPLHCFVVLINICVPWPSSCRNALGPLVSGGLDAVDIVQRRSVFGTKVAAVKHFLAEPGETVHLLD